MWRRCSVQMGSAATSWPLAVSPHPRMAACSRSRLLPMGKLSTGRMPENGRMPKFSRGSVGAKPQCPLVACER